MTKIIDLNKERIKRQDSPEVERLRLEYEKSFITNELKEKSKFMVSRYKELSKLNERIRELSQKVHNVK